MKKFIKDFEKRTKELVSSKKKSKEFLLRSGIYNKNGSLNKNYLTKN